MITKTFAFHEPSQLSKEKITELREQFSNMKKVLETVCPPSRETSLALTKLEETAMWAVKAVVSNDKDSKAHVKE